MLRGEDCGGFRIRSVREDVGKIRAANDYAVARILNAQARVMPAMRVLSSQSALVNPASRVQVCRHRRPRIKGGASWRRRPISASSSVPGQALSARRRGPQTHIGHGRQTDGFMGGDMSAQSASMGAREVSGSQPKGLTVRAGGVLGQVAGHGGDRDARFREEPSYRSKSRSNRAFWARSARLVTGWMVIVHVEGCLIPLEKHPVHTDKRAEDRKQSEHDEIVVVNLI